MNANWCATAALLAMFASTLQAADLPSPKTGGPGGAAIALLVLNDHGKIDEKYEKELTDAGYRLVKTSWRSKLSAEYLKQFAVVMLAELPYEGQSYTVGGHQLQFVESNLNLVHDYLASGGGVALVPAMSEFGEAYAHVYNGFLQRYGGRYLPEQLRDDANTKGAYAAGTVAGGHAITQGVTDLLYPINVMRWDHAYSTTPIVAGKDWTILASGKDTAGTHQAIDNARVGPRLSDQRTLLALAPAGKGRLVVSAVHAYYTLTYAYNPDKHIGENDTGVIAGIPLHGEPNGRPSQWGKLIDQSLRFLAAHSIGNGMGKGTVELPAQPAPPTTTAVIDWHTAEPPKTWAHRVIGVQVGKNWYWDELPDPEITGEIKYFKVLVGPRTAYSSGTGTVKEYREAALKAGYHAIAFAETLADTTREKWARFLADCDANTDKDFACLPGLDMEDFQGGRYLVLGARRFPDPSWLTPDGKKLQAVRMLSLGWYGHMASVHRSKQSPLHPKMYKHFQGVTVATYDTKGKLVDDSLSTYQWEVASDSNPIPVTAHEVTSPADVATAAKTGYQQIMPAPTLAQAVHSFRFGFVHYFECPLRYFISEGPTLEGWSIRNKDLGPVEDNRDHWRLGVGVTSDQPIAEATLYDGFELVRRWTSADKSFRATVDGFHDGQKQFMLIARDAAGRRVISPGIRTTTRNWRLRCGDRQNWLGSTYIYTGWKLDVGGYRAPLAGTREGGSYWVDDKGENPCVILDFPFFSNHAQINDVDITTKYTDAKWEDIGGDAKPTFAVKPTEFADGSVRLTHFNPHKRGDLAVGLVEASVRLKREAQPVVKEAVYPAFAQAMGKNDLLILPNQPAQKISELKAPIDVPAGSYVGGIIPLSDGMRLDKRSIGPAAPAADKALPKDTQWSARYLIMKTGNFHWRQTSTGYDIDAIAEAALNELGFRGQAPFKLDLKQGKLDHHAYFLDLTAQNGGVAGRIVNDKSQVLLANLPLRITGVNPRCALAVWRSDTQHLDYFAAFNGVGYVSVNGDKSVEFYAGNVATCDPQLVVSVVVWNDKEAWFRVHNPTDRDITTTLATAPAIRGYQALSKSISVKAGQCLDVK